MEGYSCSCIGWPKVLWWCQFFPIWATDLICVCSVAKSCPPHRNPLDCSLPGFSFHGIFQARILEWMVISFSKEFPNTGIKPTIPASPELAGRFRFVTTESPGKAIDLINPNQNQKLFCRYWQIDSRVYKNPEWMTQSWRGRTKL